MNANNLNTEKDNARALNARGIGKFQQGDIAGALEDLGKAGMLQADFPEPWNNSGLLRNMLGQLTAAIADFDRALAIRPDYPEALTNRARARMTIGDLDGAQSDFDGALELVGASPFAASILHNRGMLRQKLGDVAGALADFDRALQIDPAHTATYVNRGSLRKETGDLQGGLADFNKALEQSSPAGLAAILHGRGGVRVLLNDFAGAIEDYDRALSLEPEQFQLYISRGNARYHHRDPRGVADFRLAIRLDPEGAAREFLRILSADVQRAADAVLDNCTKHLRLNERDAVALARRGLTLLLLGRKEEAIPDLNRVCELVPDLRNFLHRLVQLAGHTVSPPKKEDIVAAVFAQFA